MSYIAKQKSSSEVSTELVDKCTSEGDQQALLFRWALKQSLTIPELGLLFAVPNGGHRNKTTAARMKIEGVRSGVPDMFLPVPRPAHGGPRRYAGLFIELKSEKGHTSSHQDWWLNQLAMQGYRAEVCYGAQAARQTLLGYLGLTEDSRVLPLNPQ